MNGPVEMIEKYSVDEKKGLDYWFIEWIFGRLGQVKQKQIVAERKEEKSDL